METARLYEDYNLDKEGDVGSTKHTYFIRHTFRCSFLSDEFSRKDIKPNKYWKKKQPIFCSIRRKITLKNL